LAALRTLLIADELKRGRMSCNHWFSFSRKNPDVETPGKDLVVYGVLRWDIS
jgi:hypothetical protein